MFDFFKKYQIFSIINKLVDETDVTKRLYLENLFIVSFYAPWLVVGTIFHVINGFFWQFSAVAIYGLAALFLLSAITYFVVMELSIREITRSHLLCLIVANLLIWVYFVYAKRLGLSFWLVYMVVGIPTILSLDFRMNKYLIITALIQVTHMASTGFQNYFGYTFADYAATTALLSASGAALLFVKVLHKYTIESKRKQYLEIVEQKETLTSLYEEIVASEEELMEKNELLTSYTKKIAKSNDELNYYANYDTLTGLPNRKQIQDRVDELIAKKDESVSFSFVYIDLDDFKIVNDTLGHKVGDELLRRVAGLLNKHIAVEDILGRVGGDEFALLIMRRLTREQIRQYLEELCLVFDQKITIDHYQITTTASLGVAMYPLDGNDMESLISAADTAMYHAKNSKLSHIAFFEDSMRAKIIDRVLREDMLISALDNDELFVEYQPLLQSQTGSVIGFEALVRWKSPQLGHVPPLEFIGIAEDTGLISKITQFVLDDACRKITQFKAHYQRDMYISLNLSPVQFDDIAIIDEVNQIIQSHDINPQYLVFEMTETAFINQPETTISIINHFKSLGIRIALDDFGTGYASLQHLLSLPFDILKIDRSFIEIIDSEVYTNRDVVRAIIALGRSLDMTVVAEGVETSIQYTFLKEIGCDILQGYYFSKPLAADKIINNEIIIN